MATDKQLKYEKKRTRKRFEAAARRSVKGRFGFTIKEKFRASRRQRQLNGIRTAKRIVPKKTHVHMEDHSSTQERERRRRQIARGQLKRENGLVA